MDLEEPSEVVVRCHRRSGMSVRLSDRQVEDASIFIFTVWVQGGGMQARVDGVEADEDLVAFVERLAADFRGWEGERRCYAGHLELGATFHTGGNVLLTWRLRPPLQPDLWMASVQTWLEAGEQMTAFAADIRAFAGQ